MARPHLEAHAGFHLLAQDLCNDLIEMAHNLDSQLRLDTTTADQLIKSVRESKTDAVGNAMISYGSEHPGGGSCTSYCGKAHSTLPLAP